MKELLKTREVAESLRVGEPYVRELIRRRKIKAYREGKRGGYRILRQEVDRYINSRLEESFEGAGGN